MGELRISIVQSDIRWEDKERNLEHFHSLISPLKGNSNLVVFPETFSTGFSMNVLPLAETNNDKTIRTIQEWSEELNIAIAGSFMAKDDENNYYNRGFFVAGKEKYFYDKRHLFRMGEENNIFTPGTDYPIISYQGWNIRLTICYDLRFPVWSRNKQNEYDLLLNVSNWPKARAGVWETLLSARAIENAAYVCGVNRIGNDGHGLAHQGDSLIVDYKGNLLFRAETNKESVHTEPLDKNALVEFRNKFPVWKDADNFDIM
ncbi:MAG: nitrilase family protein [Dysgonamonadaceae bacterium]|jgi:predicted amidohydrolase|nr:nitrilase family protein [Dysgonamonadaceae bacterium]